VDTFAVNVYSAFFMSQACLPHMRRGGAIINTSSVAAYKGRYDMCVQPYWMRRCLPARAHLRSTPGWTTLPPRAR
jgi:NAD(P)-dependent dehydrogenase (short-subunit alcohol dehydrogenase family)